MNVMVGVLMTIEIFLVILPLIVGAVLFVIEKNFQRMCVVTMKLKKMKLV